MENCYLKFDDVKVGGMQAASMEKYVLQVTQDCPELDRETQSKEEITLTKRAFEMMEGNYSLDRFGSEVNLRCSVE